MRVSVQTSDWESEIGKFFDKELRQGKVATLAAMQWAAKETKDNWRAQIVGAGLGNRLSKTVRSDAYQNPAKPSPGAWALVWSKAPKLTAVHESGATIRSANGFWLAIPTKAAGRGTGSRKMTPPEWEKKNGRQLRFIFGKGVPSVLIDEGRKAPGNVMVSRGGKLAAPRTRKKPVVMFVLVAQVRLKKRLDLLIQAERVASGLPARIAALWK